MILLAASSNDEDLQLEKQNTRFYKIKCIEKLYQLGLSLRQNKIPVSLSIYVRYPNL